MKTPKGMRGRLAVAAMLACSLQILAAVVHAQGNGHGPPVDARTQLEPPVDGDDVATGDIRLKEHKGRSAIHVFVRHLNQGEVYDVTISGDGVTEPLGSITIPGGDEGDGDGNGDGDGDGQGAPRCFEATLTGDQEVQMLETEATGRAKFVLSGRDRDVLHYQVKIKDLSGPPVGAHIHIGASGVDGPVLVPLNHETLRGRGH